MPLRVRCGAWAICRRHRGYTAGTGTASLRAVEPEPTSNGLQWPKGKVPFPKVKKDPKTAKEPPFWRGIVTTMGEIAGIVAISVGSGWYSFGAGLIIGGIGLFAVSFLLGMPE